MAVDFEDEFHAGELRAEVARKWGAGGASKLASATNYSVGYVSLWMHGYRPSPRALRRLSRALGPGAMARIIARKQEVSR